MLPQDRETTAFSLVEVLLVVTLLSLIVLALMAVFSGTQRAFRAGVTQTDVLEGGRLATEQIANDLRGMMPSGGTNFGAVNFNVRGNANYSYFTPLVQSLPGSSTVRSNLLNCFFMLGRQNTTWVGIGYVVDDTSTNTYTLYRFYSETSLINDPKSLYLSFSNNVQFGWWTNMSRIADGVVHLTVRANDPAGHWMNGSWVNGQYQPYTGANDTYFIPYSSALNSPFSFGFGEAQFDMFSNTVPAAVDFELGILEDAVLARAASISSFTARTNYLAGHAGAVHLFRQRVNIPNVDRTAYP